MPSDRSWPIVIVTGANSGVGFGICHRLLLQLSSGRCTDAQPKYKLGNVSLGDLQLPCDGLTLILACRNRQRAEAAQKQLYDLLDGHISRLQKAPSYDGHAEKFRENLNIDIHTIDLASIQSVFNFADKIIQTYPYVSHLVCNAGVVCFSRIDWPTCLKQFATDFIGAVSTPVFFLQHPSHISDDGLGWLWQCNVFGHYVLFRVLEPHLTKYAGLTGARVIWISSHEATSRYYDPTDWQLTKSLYSYQSSKYQTNLIAMRLDENAMKGHIPGSPVVRHCVALPGVAGTNIASVLLGPITSVIMYLTFYLARLLGSIYHPITPFKAAISTVHLALVPLNFLPSTTTIPEEFSEPGKVGVLYVSETDRWGNERVGTLKMMESTGEQEHARELLESCDQLLESFCDKDGRKMPCV